MQPAQTAKLIVSDADVTSRCRCINMPGSYMIFPRANRVEHHLPGFEGVLAQVLSTPQHGAKFVEHELLVEPNGRTLRTPQRRIRAVLLRPRGPGAVQAGRQAASVGAGQLCLAAAARRLTFASDSEALSRVAWIRRRYVQAEGIAVPEPFWPMKATCAPIRPTPTWSST